MMFLNPEVMKILASQTDPRVAQCSQQGGTWDAGAQQCVVGSTIPLWAYAAGGVAVLGAAWYFLLRR